MKAPIVASAPIPAASPTEAAHSNALFDGSVSQSQGEVLAVSPAEAARRVGIGRTKLYEALGAGDLASIKIGTRRLIRIAELNRWLSAHESVW